MQLLIRTLMLLLISPVCLGEIYKWTDENGQVHYGERPKGTDTEKIEIRPTTPKQETDYENNRRDKQRKLTESLEEERIEKKQKKAAAKEKERIVKENCAQLKDYHRSLKEVNLLYDMDEEGNRVFLSEEAHLKEIADVEELLNKHCK